MRTFDELLESLGLSEALPSGLTEGQRLELQYAVECWDEILVKEGLPTTILKVVPFNGMGTRFGDCDQSNIIRVGIVTKIDSDGEKVLDLPFMRGVFLHEVAHALRYKKDGDRSGVHDRKWQMELNQVKARHTPFMIEKERLLQQKVQRVSSRDKYGWLPGGSDRYYEPGKRK